LAELRRSTHCGLIATRERYANFVRSTCKGEDPDQHVSERCTALWNDAFETMRRQRYPKATDADMDLRCREVDCSEREVYELAVLASHDAAVTEEGAATASRIVAEHGRALGAAGRQEAEDAESRRRILTGIAVVLLAAQQARGQGTTRAPQTPVLMRPAACGSDFDCGMGMACVKPAYESTGTCVVTVNASGNQVFEIPRSDSVMPAGAGCTGGGTCPTGYRCELSGRFAGQCAK
jgi:hypothetical protein